jgi:hypothetical protein
MTKPLAKVKVGDLLTAEKMNEIIERINDLEKRLDQMKVKDPVRKSLKVNPKRKASEKRIQKSNSTKTKISKVKTPKRKAQKRKSPKTGFLSRIALVK